MPHEDTDDELTVNSGGRLGAKRETRLSESVASAAASTTTTGDRSRPSTPSSLAFMSQPSDLAINDSEEVDDPNDPEWESSQGSAPRSKKR